VQRTRAISPKPVLTPIAPPIPRFASGRKGVCRRLPCRCRCCAKPLVGNSPQATQFALSSLVSSNGKGRAGYGSHRPWLERDAAQARRLADEFRLGRSSRRHDCAGRRLPMIRASASLGAGHSASAASAALHELAPAGLYEVGDANTAATHQFSSFILPTCAPPLASPPDRVLRPPLSFRKFSIGPALSPTKSSERLPTWVLARAYALQAGVAPGLTSSSYIRRPCRCRKGTLAYQDFLALWKDADPDISHFESKPDSEYAGTSHGNALRSIGGAPSHRGAECCAPAVPGGIRFCGLRILRFRNPMLSLWYTFMCLRYSSCELAPPFHANLKNTGTLSPAFAALTKTLRNCAKIVQITSSLATLTKNASATPLLATHFQNKGVPAPSSATQLTVSLLRPISPFCGTIICC